MSQTTDVSVPEVAREAWTPLASVYSIYMPNIDPQVCEYQAKVMHKFLPEGWVFAQVSTELKRYAHADAMKKLIETCNTDVIAFLDIDCIPLTVAGFLYMYDHVRQGELVGCAQRANHIPNGAHIYAGPFCMAFSIQMYRALGSPVLREAMLEGKPYRPIPGQRGDVCEELTYVWEQYKHKVTLLRLTAVEKLLWNLEPGRERFGHGTTYGDLFYHAFEARVSRDRQNRFIEKCKQVLG